MRSIIFAAASRVLLPVMLILSVIVLLRGHNEPGGGFVGGLLAAAGFSLYALAIGAAPARRVLRVDPRVLIGAGLLVASLSGLPALLQGAPYLEGRWMSLLLPGFPDPIKIGTPLAFDIGVYLLVLGGALLMVLTLEEVRHEPVVRD
jgi:multicomponent Na+:H+ antiporter subunit B